MKQPIGIMDSGVGGLTVVKEVMRQLPNEQVIYIGDTARCPYGPRTKDEVRAFTWQMTRFLLEQNVKMLVIACNTATAVTLSEIRSALKIPVLGVIHPGARAAIKTTQNNQIGVIGTEGTIRSEAYVKALMSINRHVHVKGLACPKFVPLVESGEFKGPFAEKIVEESLSRFKGNGIDTLILGCTHYPLLEETISRYLGPDVQIISSGEETAREMSTILYFQDLLNSSSERPTHQFYTTGSSGLFSQIACDWLDLSSIQVESISLRNY
ncbi:glutamate racemase [Bacillus oleivorans]|uniref:Glutamate racemase n=1 Tax=Bacillus oleivorans TaxID=1448271 RepID=A0A285CV67_9BACI|nr:glutamate racemase [Bacillus oleivorans]SNX71489.1 glutamate racemase [Bacillus oleivorans]